MEIRAIAPNEWKYTYSQSMQIRDRQTASVISVVTLTRLVTAFIPLGMTTRPQWKTDEFKAELDEVINALRSG